MSNFQKHNNQLESILKTKSNELQDINSLKSEAIKNLDSIKRIEKRDGITAGFTAAKRKTRSIRI